MLAAQIIGVNDTAVYERLRLRREHLAKTVLAVDIESELKL